MPGMYRLLPCFLTSAKCTSCPLLLPFRTVFQRVHRIVGAASPVLDMLPANFLYKKLAVRCRVEVCCADTSAEGKNDYRTRGSGRQPGLGGGVQSAGTIYGDPVR